MRLIDADALIETLSIAKECEDCKHNEEPYCRWKPDVVDICEAINDAPTIEPEQSVDADKLKRCRFEYINACKLVAHPTPDTSKNDIYDAHAVIKALYPIFGDEEWR